MGLKIYKYEAMAKQLDDKLNKQQLDTDNRNNSIAHIMPNFIPDPDYLVPLPITLPRELKQVEIEAELKRVDINDCRFKHLTVNYGHSNFCTLKNYPQLLIKYNHDALGFKLESKLMQIPQHPNIIKIFLAYEVNNVYKLVIPRYLCDVLTWLRIRGSARNTLKCIELKVKFDDAKYDANNSGDNQLDELQVLHIAVQLCAALTHCNFNNLVHRDVRLDNIFIQYHDTKNIKLEQFDKYELLSSRIVLGDFGAGYDFGKDSKEFKCRLTHDRYELIGWRIGFGPEVRNLALSDCGVIINHHKTDSHQLGMVLLYLMGINVKQLIKQDHFTKDVDRTKYFTELSSVYSEELINIIKGLLDYHPRYRWPLISAYYQLEKLYKREYLDYFGILPDMLKLTGYSCDDFNLIKITPPKQTIRCESCGESWFPFFIRHYNCQECGVSICGHCQYSSMCSVCVELKTYYANTNKNDIDKH